MKHSARLVVVLAALLLALTFVMRPTEAQASAVPTDFESAPVVVMQSVDLQGTLDFEGGGTDLVFVQTYGDTALTDDQITLTASATPAFTMDIGTILVLGALVVMMAIALTQSTIRHDIARLVAYITDTVRLRIRSRSAGAGAPTTNDVEIHEGHDDCQGSSPKHGTDTRLPHAKGIRPLRV